MAQLVKTTHALEPCLLPPPRPCLICTSEAVPFTELLFVPKPKAGWGSCWAHGLSQCCPQGSHRPGDLSLQLSQKCPGSVPPTPRVLPTPALSPELPLLPTEPSRLEALDYLWEWSESLELAHRQQLTSPAPPPFCAGRRGSRGGAGLSRRKGQEGDGWSR